jgi:hypothetical protein
MVYKAFGAPMPLKDYFKSKKAVAVSTETVNPVDPPSTPGRNVTLRGFGKFGIDDDESPISYKKLDGVYLSDATTFNEINEISFMVSRPFTVVSQYDDEENNPGVVAINQWMKDYNMRPKITKYLEEMTRDRRGGTSYGELVSLRNPLINNGNAITVDAVTISPHTIVESMTKRDKFGRLIHLEQSAEANVAWDGLEECSSIQIIRWNENTYSKTGVSHIVPAYYDIKNYKDFRLYIMEIFKKDVRPIVQHVLQSEGLNDKQVKAHFADYQSMLDSCRSKKLYDMFMTDKWETKVIGFQGKMLDNSTLLKILDIHRREALRFPNMASGEGTNKATMEVQKRHLDQTKVKAIENKLISDLIEPIFKRVLAELGVNAPCPTIEFQAMQALDLLTQAQSDEIYTNILGPNYTKVIAERMGMKNFDPDWKLKQAEAMFKIQPKPQAGEATGDDKEEKGTVSKTETVEKEETK